MNSRSPVISTANPFEPVYKTVGSFIWLRFVLDCLDFHMCIGTNHISFLLFVARKFSFETSAVGPHFNFDSSFNHFFGYLALLKNDEVETIEPRKHVIRFMCYFCQFCLFSRNSLLFILLCHRNQNERIMFIDREQCALVVFKSISLLWLFFFLLLLSTNNETSNEKLRYYSRESILSAAIFIQEDFLKRITSTWLSLCSHENVTSHELNITQ